MLTSGAGHVNIARKGFYVVCQVKYCFVLGRWQ